MKFVQPESSYMQPEAIFKLPFTIPSLQWAIGIGAALACHHYSRTRKTYSGETKRAVYLGLLGGCWVGGLYWGYHMYQFTSTQHALRQQTVSRQQAAYHSEVAQFYFRDKFKLHDLSDEQLSRAVSYMETQWTLVDQQLQSATAEETTNETADETADK